MKKTTAAILIGAAVLGAGFIWHLDHGISMSFIPEDRLGMGLVGSMDIIDNMMLRSYRRGKSVFVDRKAPENLANEIVESLQVATPDTHTPVRRLSGGNVQKVLVGREIAAAPTVLMAVTYKRCWSDER